MLIHCWFGVSRSTAASFIAACLLRPDIDEMEHAEQLRRIAPFATPNALMVTLADKAMERQGKMVQAIKAIGRGAECSEGTPYRWELDL